MPLTETRWNLKKMMHQEANENVTGYNAMLKEMQGFDKSIEGIIAEMSAAAQASGAV